MKRLGLIGVTAGVLALAFSELLAAAPELPTRSNENSEYTINVQDLDLFLSSTVIDVGSSDRKPASRNGTRTTSSKLRTGSKSASSQEGNRVVFDKLTPEHIEGLIAIKRDLEAVPNYIPLEEFSKMQQLAYWLNLHNVAVILEVAEVYPVKKLESLVNGSKNVWDEKTMTVGGVPLSIRDIENHVTTNWTAPEVVYGLFMGTVGGPNIRTTAYTEDNVVEELQLNAVEFVNSLRGMRFWGGKIKLSEHFDLVKHMFPNFKEDIKAHLLRYSRPDTRQLLEKAKSFKIDLYDWGIADLDGGYTYTGNFFNKSSAGLAWFIEAPNPQGSGPFGGGPTTVGVTDSFVNDPALTGGGASTVSVQTRALLRAIRERNIKRAKEGTVTVEEFTSEEGGRVSKKKE